MPHPRSAAAVVNTGGTDACLLPTRLLQGEFWLNLVCLWAAPQEPCTCTAMNLVYWAPCQFYTKNKCFLGCCLILLLHSWRLQPALAA